MKNNEAHYNKKTEGKPNVNKVYPRFIEEIAKAMDHGDVKYGYKNWHDYKDINELMSALGRHYYKCCNGEILDKETMLNHLAQVGSNAMMIMYLIDNDIIKVEGLYYGK